MTAPARPGQGRLRAVWSLLRASAVGVGVAVVSIAGPVVVFAAAAFLAQALPAGAVDSADTVVRAAAQSAAAVAVVARVLVDPVATPAGQALAPVVLMAGLLGHGLRTVGYVYVSEPRTKRLARLLAHLSGAARWPVGVLVAAWISGSPADLEVSTGWVAGCAAVLTAACAGRRSLLRRAAPVGGARYVVPRVGAGTRVGDDE